MVMQQVALDIPRDVLEKLATGEWIRYGSVVRNHAGHIVAHLKELSPKESQSGVTDRALQIAKTHPFVSVGIVILTTAGGALAATVVRRKYTKTKLLGDRFNAAMSAYISAIRDQTMSLEIVNEMLEAWESSISSSDRKADEVLDPADLRLVAAYIRKFVDVNSTEGGEALFEDDVIDLHAYLERQKAVIKESA